LLSSTRLAARLERRSDSMLFARAKPRSFIENHSEPAPCELSARDTLLTSAEESLSTTITSKLIRSPSIRFQYLPQISRILITTMMTDTCGKLFDLRAQRNAHDVCSCKRATPFSSAGELPPRAFCLVDQRLSRIYPL
jgi:hypothetical protein